MTNRTRRHLTALVGVTALVGWPRASLSAAEPSIRLAQTATYRDGPVPAWHQIAPPDAVVSVFRGGRLLRVAIGAELLPGDEVQSGPRSAAIIRFRDRGDVFIDADTKVRIGSLEVIFGRIFARVRGLFEVRSENVTAAVEGTRFLFEVTTDRNVRVAVSEGAVIGRPRSTGWAGVRLRQGQQLRSVYPNKTRPRTAVADRRELDQWERWADQVMAATPMDAALPGVPGATSSPGGPAGGSPGGTSGSSPGTAPSQ